MDTNTEINIIVIEAYQEINKMYKIEMEQVINDYKKLSINEDINLAFIGGRSKILAEIGKIINDTTYKILKTKSHPNETL